MILFLATDMAPVFLNTGLFVTIVAALIFVVKAMAKASTSAVAQSAQTTELVVNCTKENTKALTNLQGELNLQGQLNRAALDTQQASHKLATQELKLSIESAECAGSSCPLSELDKEKLLNGLDKKTD